MARVSSMYQMLSFSLPAKYWPYITSGVARAQMVWQHAQKQCRSDPMVRIFWIHIAHP